MNKTASGIGRWGTCMNFVVTLKKEKEKKKRGRSRKNQISNKKKIQRVGGEKRINRQVEEGETR